MEVWIRRCIMAGQGAKVQHAPNLHFLPVSQVYGPETLFFRRISHATLTAERESRNCYSTAGFSRILIWRKGRMCCILSFRFCAKTMP